MGIRDNVIDVLGRIDSARREAGGQDVLLIAVSKTYPASAVDEANAAGLRVFGENRVQELLPKMAEVASPVTWRLIGHLQSNKINKIAGVVDHVDSLDSLSTAKKLNRRLLDIGAECRVLIEVNTSGESAKNGILPEGLPAFADALAGMEALRPEGLMTIGPLYGSRDDVRRAFALLRTLREQTAGEHPEYRELSMGMSGDFEDAIREGATMVRIGSLIFGARDYS